MSLRDKVKAQFNTIFNRSSTSQSDSKENENKDNMNREEENPAKRMKLSHKSDQERRVIGTSFDNDIVHHVVNVPGITIEGLSGNITADISKLLVTKYNLALNENKNNFTYKFAISMDKNFNNSERILTINSNDSKTSEECNNDELIKYKLFKKKNNWYTKEKSLIGVQLIERHWYHLNSNKNNNNNKNKNKNNINDIGFTVMQFNTLADGLSGGYIDSNDSTRINKSIDNKIWFNKCEKAFLRVNPLCLQWNYRGLRLIEEILRFECDLIGLQECDHPQWMYNLYLSKYNYNMVYVKKSDSPCLKMADTYLNNKKKIEFEIENNRFENTIKFKSNDDKKKWKLKPDGCCIFYKSDKFKILSKIPTKLTKSLERMQVSNNGDVTNINNNNNNDNNNDNNNKFEEIVDFQTKEEIYEWLRFCGGEINGNESKLLPWLKNLKNNVQGSNNGEKQKEKQNENRTGNNNNCFVSMRCSVTFDLIDHEKKIYDETNGKFLGYGKLQVLDKKKSAKEGKNIFKTAATTFIALHMRHIETKKEFIFVTTHLKSSKDSAGEKMRVGQMHALFGYGPWREINKNGNVSQPIVNNPNNLPIILCCDMNAKPENTMKFDKDLKQMVKDYGFECYQLVTGIKKINNDNDEKNNSNSNDNNNNNNNNNGLGFESLYYLALGNKEPKYTTWKERRNEENSNSGKGDVAKHTIDYIFRKDNKNELNITHFLGIPDIDDKSQLGKALLPDWHYPSDHFSLAVRLEWNQ